MNDDPITRIEAALADPSLWDEGAALADTWVAVHAVHAACNPVAIRTLLDRLKAAEASVDAYSYEIARGRAENERLREALVMARDYVSADLAERRDTYKGYEKIGRVAEAEADLAQIDKALEANNG